MHRNPRQICHGSERAMACREQPCTTEVHVLLTVNRYAGIFFVAHQLSPIHRGLPALPDPSGCAEIPVLHWCWVNTSIYGKLHMMCQFKIASSIEITCLLLPWTYFHNRGQINGIRIRHVTQGPFAHHHQQPTSRPTDAPRVRKRSIQMCVNTYFRKCHRTSLATLCYTPTQFPSTRINTNRRSKWDGDRCYVPTVRR